MIPSNIIYSYSIKASISKRAATLLFISLEKFLDNAYKGKEKSPNKEVDLVWHYFLLFTIEYRDYCKKRYNAFIHHVPSTMKPNDCDAMIENFSK